MPMIGIHKTDIKEIKQFLGLFFLMGIVHKPGSLVLYAHLQCSYEQKSFSVAPKVSPLQ